MLIDVLDMIPRLAVNDLTVWIRAIEAQWVASWCISSSSRTII